MTYRVAFSTPWFEIEESIPERAGELPYYRMTGPNGVICLPFTPEGDIVMVRQYRPSLERITIELPAGAIEGGETILAAAAREILEETGRAAADLAILGPGRLHMNRTTHLEHFVLAFDARPAAGAALESGVEPLTLTRPEVLAMIRNDSFEQIAALSFLGLASAKLGVNLLTDSIALIHERVKDEAARRRPDGN